eukprot:6035805-Amphidinium_carterae.1
MSQTLRQHCSMHEWSCTPPREFYSAPEKSNVLSFYKALCGLSNSAINTAMADHVMMSQLKSELTFHC